MPTTHNGILVGKLLAPPRRGIHTAKLLGTVHFTFILPLWFLPHPPPPWMAFVS